MTSEIIEIINLVNIRQILLFIWIRFYKNQEKIPYFCTLVRNIKWFYNKYR